MTLVRKYAEHFVIPDTQVKPGVPTDHLTAAGNYVVERQPDVIVHLGDHFDMHSLSSYDKGTRKAEGARFMEDINAGIEAMQAFLEPIHAYNRGRAAAKKKQYKPRMVYCIGNHEERIMRHVNANPVLEGTLSYNSLRMREMGWEQYDFLEAVEIDGILYSHFFPRSPNGRIMQNRRGAPNARLQVMREMQSCTAGHLQGMDFHVHQTGHTLKYGLIAGSFYQHEEEYLTPQGTAYWRGCIYKHEVRDGRYDPMFLSLEYLMNNWL
jgi:hypothetical protein